MKGYLFSEGYLFTGFYGNILKLERFTVHFNSGIPTEKSQIFVRYLISYFRTFEKSAKFNTGWKFNFALRPSNFNVILFGGPRKYEN